MKQLSQKYDLTPYLSRIEANGFQFINKSVLSYFHQQLLNHEEEWEEDGVIYLDDDNGNLKETSLKNTFQVLEKAASLAEGGLLKVINRVLSKLDKDLDKKVRVEIVDKNFEDKKNEVKVTKKNHVKENKKRGIFEILKNRCFDIAQIIVFINEISFRFENVSYESLLLPDLFVFGTVVDKKGSDIVRFFDFQLIVEKFQKDLEKTQKLKLVNEIIFKKTEENLKQNLEVLTIRSTEQMKLKDIGIKTLETQLFDSKTENQDLKTKLRQFLNDIQGRKEKLKRIYLQKRKNKFAKQRVRITS